MVKGIFILYDPKIHGHKEFPNFIIQRIFLVFYRTRENATSRKSNSLSFNPRGYYSKKFT